MEATDAAAAAYYPSHKELYEAAGISDTGQLRQVTDAAAAACCPGRKEVCAAAGIADTHLRLLPSNTHLLLSSAAGYRRSSCCMLPQPQKAV
jgi:hypothetical protein